MEQLQAVSANKLFGAIMLIAGSCIGAAMLAMPISTGIAGFLPSILVLAVCWAFMTTTAFLLLEVNLSLGSGTGIVSMARKTLGRTGGLITWVLFCFLFYLILVAYTAAIGGLFSDFIVGTVGLPLDPRIGSLLFTILFGYVVYSGVGVVDHLNRFLMFGLVVAYVLLVGMGVDKVQTTLLAYQKWGYASIALPVVILSFGFHNMLPSMIKYLEADRKKLRLAVLIGSLIPLLVYLVWEWVILGVVPAEGPEGIFENMTQGNLATQALRKVTGRGWISSTASCFSFFAIVTSLAAQGLSLFHFLGDGIGLAIDKSRNRGLLCLLVFAPPLLACLYKPDIFVFALNLAGTYGAMVLFGIMPALMAWVIRFRKPGISDTLVPGGKLTLVVVIIFSITIITVQVMSQFGFLEISSGP